MSGIAELLLKNTCNKTIGTNILFLLLKISLIFTALLICVHLRRKQHTMNIRITLN